MKEFKNKKPPFLPDEKTRLKDGCFNAKKLSSRMSLRETISGNKRPGWFLTFEGWQQLQFTVARPCRSFTCFPFARIAKYDTKTFVMFKYRLRILRKV
jgi:hypothetical protein